MKKIPVGFALLILFVFNILAAQPKKYHLVSVRLGDVFFSPTMGKRVYQYSAWPKGVPSEAQTILVPFEIAVKPLERRKYIAANFSYDGTPITTPTVYAMPTETPTSTMTPEEVDTPTPKPTAKGA